MQGEGVAEFVHSSLPISLSLVLRLSSLKSDILGTISPALCVRCIFGGARVDSVTLEADVHVDLLHER